MLRSREYIRESVEGLDGEPEVGDNPKRSDKVSTSYPTPGQIKIKRRSGKTSKPDVSYVTFDLRNLPKTTLSVASR